jgi:hypothetical protein
MCIQRTNWPLSLGHAGLSSIAMALGLCLVPSSVSAQSPPPGGIAPPARTERPYRGLFGSGVSETSQSLTFEGSIGGGLVDNPVAEQGSASPAGTSSNGGGSGVGSATIDYSLGRKRYTFNATSVTNVDYYPSLPQSMLPRYIITGAVAVRPSASTNITISPGFKNLPEFSFEDLFNPEEGGILPPSQNFGMTVKRYKRIGLNVDASQKLAKRSTLNLSWGYGHGMIGGATWDSQRYEATVTQNVSKGLSVYGGYVYGQQTFHGADGRTSLDRHPNVTFGVNFNKPLSLTRRTTLAVSAGVAQMQDRILKETRNELIGGVTLAREFGRTWITGISVGRDVRFIESLAAPLLNDTLTFNLKGSFSRRLQFGSAFGRSSGLVGGDSGYRLDTYYGSAQLSFALNRTFGLGADYGYYRQSNPIGGLSTGTVGSLNRKSLRTYLQVWVPLVTRTKRP